MLKARRLQDAEDENWSDLSDKDVLQGYEHQRLRACVAEWVREVMQERHLDPDQLAKRLGVSAARVSQILSGGENLTLRSLAALEVALNSRLSFDYNKYEADLQKHAEQEVAEIDHFFDDRSHQWAAG